MKHKTQVLMVGIVLAMVLTSCAAPVATAPAAPAAPAAGGGAVTMRIGYFANITHSQALVGIARRDFQKALGLFAASGETPAELQEMRDYIAA